MGIVDQEFLLKNILGTHCNEKKVKINISVIYGSSDGNSYNRAKDFLNELIEYFNNVHLFLNDINEIINKDIYINHINSKNNYSDVVQKKDYNEKKIEIKNNYKNHKCDDHDNVGSNIIFKSNHINPSLNRNDMNILENEIIEYFKLRFDQYQVNNNNNNKKKNKEEISRSGYENMVTLYFNKNINYLESYKENIKMFNSKFRNYVDCIIDNNKIGKIYFNLIDGNNHDYYSFFDSTENYNLNMLFFFISTSSHGSFPNNSFKIDEIFTDMLNDFRIEKNYLKDIFFSCIGFGNKEYGDKYFCIPIKKCEKYIHSLGAQKLYKTLKLCDTQDNEETLFLWKCNIFKTLSLSLFFYSFNYMKRWYMNKTIYDTLSYYCYFFSNHTNFYVNQSEDNKYIHDQEEKEKKKKKKKKKKNSHDHSINSMDILQVCHSNKEYKENNALIDHNNNKCFNNEIYNTHSGIYYSNVKDVQQMCLSNIDNEENNLVNNEKKKIKDKTNITMNEKREEVDVNEDIDLLHGDIQKIEGCTNCNCESMNEYNDKNNTYDTNHLSNTNNVETYKDSTSESEASSNDSYVDDEDEQIEVEDLISGEKKDMLSSSQRNKLTKEGYKIVGSHSAVKLCRWTKSQVRGRGGCYKHTFYGINSYQCMEATPSLACANKCVFCWRHHKNPVGVKWRWNMDKAEIIVEDIIKKHKAMIKELKGIYGIIIERFEKAMNIKHCALSLVGEPIMYPEINKLIDELHKRNISTFLVTNAQFPAELQNLNPVTQLYLSIDAPNKEALKNIDRPLFKDFWDRYIKCIKILKNRKERKVFRFTLVKEYNMMENEINSYINLIELGYPDFIEIKAVTYCGSSQGYQLTMKNIPWHEEVYQFAWNLINKKKSLSDIYEISCEHKHSCSILIAKKIFKINNKWNTWIDYEKFQQLIKNKENFNALDYSVETPHWAIYGSQESGFSPCEKRVYTKGKYKNKNQPS
ncbi:tRNA-YW synthesizing protein, putative [Plasmodium gaboni]|uniref:tRNA 4-demethylwyosine synthase (AdoMet-dependent) n=1 Tax=Plasmodium gaboni TaxID=647221 RepID=A0ABY1UIY3_9APIC|nr:tRNA-YW synthesizing protein, putative [Plasmodium gaboni]